MKKILKRFGVMILVITMLIQSFGSYAYAAETEEIIEETIAEKVETESVAENPEIAESEAEVIENETEPELKEKTQETESPEDIDLNDSESILSWIEENIPENLNDLVEMPEEWWDSLLPNQRQVAENLAMPVYRGGEYAVSFLAFTPVNGDEVAHMSLSSTGITDGYGNTLWKITNGGSNAYCLDHGASCKKSYAYGNFQQVSGEVAYLIQNYGQSSTVSGYISIQMAIWALQAANTEAEAYSYAYTWYLKSYDESNADAWAKTTVQFYKLAAGKSGTIWRAEGPAGSQSVGKYDEFVTTSYSSGEEGGEVEPEPELVEPEFALIEDSVEVTYEIKVRKSDWQTNVGLAGCKVDIFENGTKIKTVTTDANGEASFETTKSETYTAEYCSNYDELTPEQQASIGCFTSRSEALANIEEQMNDFANKNYSYSCREVTAPTGYVWQKNEKSVSITGNGKGTLSITNERTLGAVELVKYDTESESSTVQGEASLEGAVYGIYAAEDIVHQDKKTGVLFKKDELVATAEIGKSPKRNADGYILNEDGSRHIENPNGKIAYTETPGKTLFGDLELGKYYIKEITPAEGYMRDETAYEVTFTYKDQMVKIETRDEKAGESDNTLHVDDDSDSKTVYSGDYVIKQGIQFVKTSDNAYQTELKPIEGAGFSVYLISDLSAVKSGELTPLGESWGSDDIMTFYEYDFTEEPKAVLYKRSYETWTEGDEKWLKSLGGDKYEVTEMFTDADGRIETPELPYGTYVIVETTTPENHVCAKPFIVYITQDGGVLYTDETKEQIEKSYTAEEAIRYGDRKETKKREGRVLQKQRIINNTITKTFLRVVKADEEFLVQPGTYVKAEEVVRGTVLKEGAQYRLRCLTMDLSEESLIALNWKYDSEGYLSYYDPNAKKLTGTVANPFTTSFLKEDGKIIDCYITLPQEVPVGSYELVEVTAPEGYVVNGSEQSVKDTGEGRVNGYEIVDSPKEKLVFTIGNGAVYPDGQMGTNKYAIYDSYGNLTVTILQKNQEQKGIVDIYKYGEQLAGITSEKHFIYEEAPVEGAGFQVIAEEDIYTQELDKKLSHQYGINKEEYLLYKKGDVVATITTDRNGWGYAAGLYIGKYKIVETVAGDGFVLNKTEKSFEITPQEQTVSFDIHYVDYRNERQKLEINVLKTDADTKEVLSGALYGLYAAEDIYTNIEYIAEEDQWVIADVPELVVSKNALIAIASTGEDGKAVFEEDLPLGEYYVKELKAPAGYLLSEETFHVDGTYGSEKGGQNVEKQIYLAEFENKATQVVISKKDLTTGEELPGAALEIYDETGKLVESWISEEEPHYIKALPVGKYTLVEKTAPDGYAYAENVEFEVMETEEIQNVEMFDEPSPEGEEKQETPKEKPKSGKSEEPKDTPAEEPEYYPAPQTVVNTGDNNNMALWIILCTAVSMAGIGVFALKKKRKHQ